MKTLKTLKDDLKGISKDQALNALSDGEFLSHYAVTEDEIEIIYYEIQESK